MNNLVAWNQLKIESTELERILESNLLNNLAIEMAKFVILSHNQNKLSFLITEATLGFLGILFLVPINLLLGQKWFSTQNHKIGFAIAIFLAVVISLMLLLSLNIYLWQQAKKMKNIAKILLKIARYNDLIQNFQLITKFNNLSSVVNAKQTNTNTEIFKILQITKDSLLKSLELEKFLLQHKQLQLQERYQLFNSLEDNLVQFISQFNQEENITEYQQLLNEAINIGLSVHQELRANINKLSRF